jgi:hypothetical protein
VLVAGGALVALVVLLVACGREDYTPSVAPFQPPSGWHNITPPTDEPLAHYAVSPDVPGLIVACIGDKTAHTSAAPVGPAHIWRSRDGGATWQRLAVNDFYAGCDVALPAGGHGTIIAGDFLTPGQNTPQFIEVSHDQGDTWTTIASNATGGIQTLYDLLARGVYRGGVLYATGQLDPNNPSSDASVRFSASRDDGRTWTGIEAAPDPLLAQDFSVPAIAADQRAPGAWFRVLGRSETWFGQSAMTVTAPAAMLEHSTDGGQTWTALGPVGPVGTTAALAYSGPYALALASVASMPGRVCAAFDATFGPSAPPPPSTPPADATPTVPFGAAPAGLAQPPLPSPQTGPPYIPPTLTALAASDDGGRTWYGATVAQHTHNGGGGGGDVALDATGGCYTVDDTLTDNPDPRAQVPGVDATVWRLAAGAPTPQKIAEMTGYYLGVVGVTTAPGNATPRVVGAIMAPEPPVICGPNTCPTETPHSPHLVWTAGG